MHTAHHRISHPLVLSVHRLEIFVWPTLALVRCAFAYWPGIFWDAFKCKFSLSYSMSVRQSCMWRSRLSHIWIFLSDYVPFFAYHSFDAFFLFLLRFFLSIQSGCSWPFSLNGCTAVEHFGAYCVVRVNIFYIDSSAIYTMHSGTGSVLAVKWMVASAPSEMKFARWKFYASDLFLTIFCHISASPPTVPVACWLVRRHINSYRHHKIRITCKELIDDFNVCNADWVRENRYGVHINLSNLYAQVVARA